MRIFMCICAALLSLVCISGYAGDSSDLNSIVYTLQSQRWATTHSAYVVIAVNAIVPDKDLAHAQQQIMHKLTILRGQAMWHLVRLDYTQDRAGLEQLNMLVSSRLPMTQINHLRQRVKALSKQGQQFQLQTLSFQPSLQAIQQTCAELRQQIYQQVKEEITHLNKIYPRQHYFLHSINFGRSSAYPLQSHTLVNMSTTTHVASIVVKRNVTIYATVMLTSKVGQ